MDSKQLDVKRKFLFILYWQFMLLAWSNKNAFFYWFLYRILSYSGRIKYIYWETISLCVMSSISANISFMDQVIILC